MQTETTDRSHVSGPSAVERRVGRHRVRTVEYEQGFGWIARDPHGNEVWPDFRWASRSVARDVARQAKMAHNNRISEPCKVDHVPGNQKTR